MGELSLSPSMTSPRSSNPIPGFRAKDETASRMDAEPHSNNGKGSGELNQSQSEEAGAMFAPINCPLTNEERRETTMHRQRSNASRSLERSWSLNDGVSIGGTELEGQEADEAAREPDAGYTVGWDEHDAMNPRNMNKARRWLIVVIVSTGSLCV